MEETILDMDINKLSLEEQKFFQQETLILEVTEKVCELMEKKKIDKTMLAEKIGKSPRYITSFMRGTAKMDLRIISDIFFALDSEIEIVPKKLSWKNK